MNITEASRITGLSGSTLRKLVKRGVIQAERIESVSSIGGFVWDITASAAEITERTRHIVRKRMPSRRRAAPNAVTTIPEIAAAIRSETGRQFSDQSIYGYVRNHRVTMVRHGVNVYIPVADAERIKAVYRARHAAESAASVALHDSAGGTNGGRPTSGALADVVERLGRIEAAVLRLESMWR